jgi:hypothetical protein
MADTVDSVVLFSGRNRYAVRLTNISDGTGESAVAKIDKSTLIGPDGTEPSKIVIEEIAWSVQGFTSVRLHWDHTTDDEIAVLGAGSDYLDFRSVGGLVDPGSTGGTGDVVLTTAGVASGNTYNITLVVRLKD